MTQPPIQPSHHGDTQPPSDPVSEVSLALDEKHVRRNFVVLFFHGMLGQTGFRLLQAPTFLPTYISLLTGSNAAAGIARAVQSLGMFLSPVLSARMVEHRPLVRRMALVVGSAMRLQILFLALIALFAPRPVALVLVWLAIGLWGLGSGMQMVVFNFLLSKAIPVAQRGRLHGLRNLTSAVTLLGVSALAGWLLDRSGFPVGYGLAFLMSFVLTSIGLTGLFFLVEPASNEIRAPTPLLDRLRDVPELMRGEPDFARFVRARLFAAAARGALPFYILTLRERVDLTGTQIGALTIAFALAQGVFAVIWGFLGDRSGFRAVFVWSLVAWVVANVLILLSPTLAAGYLIFILVGAGLAGFQMAGMNLVLEFGTERDRALRIATMHSLSEAVGMVGFLAAAALAASAPMAVIFIVSLGLQVLSLAETRRLPEPRHAA